MESTQSLQRKASQSTLSVQTEPKHEPASTATPLLESSDATLAPQGWPTSPSRIKHPLFPALLDGAFDIALFAFSSCFLVFSLVVMSYDGAPTSENPRVIRILTRATGYGPTVFPLLFAAVVGRATHAILLWRLEKGERIQILDTLATSTSLTSTVISQIQLRQISALSTLLVVIWALSPIGGQASLRQISIGTAMQPSDQTFRYAVPFRSGVQAGYPTSLFIRAIYAPLEIKVSPVDLWGNVKIPNIEHYEKITEPDGNGWFTTDTSDDHMAVYVSFVGIPVDVVQNNTTPADYNFQLQTEYLQLTCVPVNYTRIHWGMEMELPPGSENATASDSVFSWSQSDREERKTYALETLKPFSFSYSRRFLGTEGTSCSVESRYVEVEVSCAVHSTCRATKVRRSQLPHLPYASTIMDFSPDNFIREFLWSIGGYDKIVTGLPPNEPSILDSYLSDPSLTSTPHAVFRNRTTVIASTINISDEAWSARFGHLLNSYWACQYSLYTLVDGIDKAPTDPSKDNITFMPPLDDEFVGNYSVLSFNWTSDDFRESKVWSSEGQKTEYIEVIKAHKPWAITLSIASLILIVFSFVPPLVRHFLTTGPDIAINFSSLATRNNSYVPIPASGSYLPAAYRFRLLKDLRLRLADADGKSDVGNLVIAAQGVEKAKYSRVRKGRVYE